MFKDLKIQGKTIYFPQNLRWKGLKIKYDAGSIITSVLVIAGIVALISSIIGDINGVFPPPSWKANLVVIGFIGAGMKIAVADSSIL